MFLFCFFLSSFLVAKNKKMSSFTFLAKNHLNAVVIKKLQELGAAQRNQPQNYEPLQRLDPPANHASSDLKKMLGRQGKKKLELKQFKLRFRRESFVKWVEEVMKHVCADKQAQPTDSK